MCMGIVLGHQPPITEVTLSMCCNSNQVYVQHGKFENTGNCMETA